MSSSETIRVAVKQRSEQIRDDDGYPAYQTVYVAECPFCGEEVELRDTMPGKCLCKGEWELEVSAVSQLRRE